MFAYQGPQAPSLDDTKEPLAEEAGFSGRPELVFAKNSGSSQQLSASELCNQINKEIWGINQDDYQLLQEEKQLHAEERHGGKPNTAYADQLKSRMATRQKRLDASRGTFGKQFPGQVCPYTKPTW